MHDQYVSRASVLAVVLWSKSAVCLTVVWVLAAFDVPMRWEGAVGAVAVISAVLAAVWQVRLYTMRICNLVRATAGLESPRPELHSVDRC